MTKSFSLIDRLRWLQERLDIESGEGIDLFTYFPSIKKFFRERRLHAVIRTIGDIVFTIIILMGLFGPQDPSSNVMLYLSWGLWWPSVVLSWFFVGRMWCGFCPFPGIGRIVQRYGLCLNLKVPDALKKNGVYWSVVLLGVIIWIEESTGMKYLPRATALLILSILGGATICAFLFPKQAWCRYLCPMGRITGVAATLALTEFRPDHSKCKGCTHFGCKRGLGNYPGCPVYLGAFNVRNNLYCLVCGHCLRACDRDSPQLLLRNPFKELVINKGRFITCSYIIPFLIGSQLARYFFEPFYFKTPVTNLDNMFSNMTSFSLLLLAGFLFAYVLSKLGAHLFGITEDELFGRFSPMIPVFVPIAFGGELIYRLEYALKNAPNFFPCLGRQFGLPYLSSLTFTLPPWLIPALSLVILLISFIAATYVLREFGLNEFCGMVTWARYWGCLAILATLASFYFVGLWYFLDIHALIT